MKKAFMYIRKSIERGAEKSIKRQRFSIMEYARNNNIEIVDEFIEVASSATLNRKELQNMFDTLAKCDDIDYILVDSFDRVSREMDHFGWILSQLKEILNIKTRLHSCTEDNDYEDDHYKLFIIMMQTFGATEERKRIVERMQVAREIKRKAGGFIGGTPPHGYKAEAGTGQYHINELEVPVVQKVFALRDDNYTMQEIADELNFLGFKTRKGVNFSAMTVQRICKHREMYEGKKQAPAILYAEVLG